MSRLILFLLLIVGVSAGVWFAMDSFLPKEPLGNGTLSVDITMDSQEVKLDGELIGSTPLNDVEVATGKKLIEIGSIWKEKISIAEGSESLVFRQIAGDEKFSYGYSLSVEPAGTLFSAGSRVVVATRPKDATIVIDGEEKGTSPISIEEVAPGEHSILIKKAGYQDQTVTVQARDDRVTRLTVDLFPSLISQRSRVEIEGEVQGEGDLDVVTRAEWGGGAVKLAGDSIRLSSWKSLDIWSTPLDGSALNNNVDLFPDFLAEFDALMQARGQITGVPFAYLIDEKGRVYEGLGIFDYDFSQFADMEYSAGSAPVMIVNSEGKVLNDDIRKSLKSLTRLLGQGAPMSAQPVTQLGNLTYTTGERRMVELKWQNTSGYIWKKDGDRRLVLGLVDSNSRSSLYDPETWRSPQEIGTFSEPQVLPGAISTFKFAFKAPIYTDTITEKFVLREGNGGAVVVGSEFTLNVTVAGEQTNMLTILDTPTGYLNVREGAGLNTPLVTTVFPGEKFGWTSEVNGYIEILMPDGKRGWVTSNYVKKRE